MKLTFLGAAGTVTGSKHLLELGGQRILADCGLFQGKKELRLANWEPFPVPPSSVDAVVLTHAHIDHTGYLPRFVRQGFEGPIFATHATRDLAAVLLRDAGKLQEEEAAYHNRKGSSRHKPALPLYTEEDGIEAARRIESFDYHRSVPVLPGTRITFQPAGHILGSATVSLQFDDGATGRRVMFSGDLGRRDSLLHLPPEPLGEADYVLLESTYGDRLHADPEADSEGGAESPHDQLTRIVRESVERGGALIIPAFAVARTQTLLFLLSELERGGHILELPVFLDSPMAIDATELYRRHGNDLRPEIRKRLEAGERPLSTRRLQITKTPEESRSINRVDGPIIVLSASGMITGGRVLHHLLQRLDRPSTTVLLVGYQVPGTRGWRLQQGERRLRIFGQNVDVRARVEVLTGLSAHGDQRDLIDWLATARHPPETTFLVHGEVPSLDGLAAAIEEELGWPTRIPARGQTVRLRE